MRAAFLLAVMKRNLDTPTSLQIGTRLQMCARKEKHTDGHTDRLGMLIIPYWYRARNNEKNHI